MEQPPPNPPPNPHRNHRLPPPPPNPQREWAMKKAREAEQEDLLVWLRKKT